MENYNNFENEIKQYLQLVQLKEVEKDVIQVLDKLLNLFLSLPKIKIKATKISKEISPIQRRICLSF